MKRRHQTRAVLLLTAISLSAAVPFASSRADAPAVLPDSPKPKAKPTTAPSAAAKKSGTTSAPTTRPAKDLSAEEMLSQMLKSPQKGAAKPLAPLPQVSGGGADKASGPGVVAPAAPTVNVLREGTFLVDRVGRLTRSADGSQAEFAFEADGTALQDPPVVIIPNLKLMQIEDAATNNTRDLRFRISGMLTEYRGRNYILLEKVVVVPDVLDKF